MFDLTQTLQQFFDVINDYRERIIELMIEELEGKPPSIAEIKNYGILKDYVKYTESGVPSIYYQIFIWKGEEVGMFTLKVPTSIDNSEYIFDFECHDKQIEENIRKKLKQGEKIESLG